MHTESRVRLDMWSASSLFCERILASWPAKGSGRSLAIQGCCRISATEMRSLGFTTKILSSRSLQGSDKAPTFDAIVGDFSQDWFTSCSLRWCNDSLLRLHHAQAVIRTLAIPCACICNQQG